MARVEDRKDARKDGETADLEIDGISARYARVRARVVGCYKTWLVLRYNAA